MSNVDRNDGFPVIAAYIYDHNDHKSKVLSENVTENNREMRNTTAHCAEPSMDSLPVD